MKQIKNVLFYFLLCSTIVLNLSCKKKVTSPPNIVWIVSEDNSKHYMRLFDEHGIATPNIESLAENGLIFTHAFSNAAVCSAARSTLIASSYGPRLASHYHRKQQLVPMPEGLQMFPAYLKANGYYTTNNFKEDYNITKDENVWDQSNNKASWRNRAEGQAFFHVQNYGTTHEGCLHFSVDDVENKKTNSDSEGVFVFPNHPQTKLFKYTNARYRDQIVQMDQEIGTLMDELKEDGLLDNTFIFYYGDHGGVLPGSKGYLYESGVHVPLLVHIPKNYAYMVDQEAGSAVTGFVSFVDFGATVLSLAGIDIPEGMDGKPFLGKNISLKEVNKRDETYSYADRFDEKYDMVRAIRKGKYKYIRSYQPFNYDGLMNAYRYKQAAYVEWKELYKKGDLNPIQSQFFETRAPELLFDLEADPYETTNIANDPEHAETLALLRQKLIDWELKLPDLSFFPEHYLIKHAFQNPVKFGQEHQADIKTYLQVANLSLRNFNDVKPALTDALYSKDPWVRYWALIACSTFAEEAKELAPVARKLIASDKELINQVRAAEFLAIIKEESPVEAMTNALYKSTDNTEALLILNSMTLMHDIHYNYIFHIDPTQLNQTVSQDKLVQIRLKYLS